MTPTPRDSLPDRSNSLRAYEQCGPDCESEYRCSCGECESNCVCAHEEHARCPDALDQFHSKTED